MTGKTFHALVLGLAIGVAGGFLIARALHRHYMNMDSEARFALSLKHLEHKLDVTSDQKQQIESLINASRAKTQGLLAGIQPQYESIRASTKTQIRALLNTEQQTKFDAICNKHKERSTLDSKISLL